MSIKSKVMKKAWSIYKSGAKHWNVYDFTKFSDCLRRAWEIVKDNVKFEAEKLDVEAEKARLEKYWASEEYKNRPKIEVDLSFIYDVPCGTFLGD